MYLGTQSGDVHIVVDTLSKVVPKYGVRTVLQQGVHFSGGFSSGKFAIAAGELSNSGRKIASFVCYQGSYIRQGYQFIYDRTDWARPTPPGFDMVLDNEMDDSASTINMMDASSRVFDMSDVAAAIAEADELPV